MADNDNEEETFSLEEMLEMAKSGQMKIKVAGRVLSPEEAVAALLKSWEQKDGK